MARVEYIPKGLHLKALAPGQIANSLLRILSAPEGAVVTASILDDDSNGLFKVSAIIAYDENFIERDRWDGSELLSFKGDTIDVVIEFSVPSSPPTDLFRAKLKIRGGKSTNNILRGWGTITAPILAEIGRIKTSPFYPSISIRQGEEGDYPISIRSIAGPSTSVRYELMKDTSAQGISMNSTTLFVPRGHTVSANLRFKVDENAPLPGGSVTVYGYAFNDGQSELLDPSPQIVVTQSKKVHEYPNITWEPAIPSAIQNDEELDAWHAGAIQDVLVLSGGGGLVVATRSGGVWTISTNDSAYPHSMGWPNPSLRCLAFGPDHPRHIYAGGGHWFTESGNDGVLHVTDPSTLPSAVLPAFWTWLDISPPSGTGAIFGIAVLNNTRRIVLACQNGVWWSNIPPTNNAANYNWIQAGGAIMGLPFFSICVGPNNTVVVGTGPAFKQANAGIYFGEWNSTGNLVFQPAQIKHVLPNGSIDNNVIPVNWDCIALASFQQNPRIMYACFAIGLDDNGVRHAGNGMFLAALRSFDGGRTWSLCNNRVKDVNPPNDSSLRWILGYGTGVGWNQCIAVSPVDSNLVAIGWRQEAPVFSRDGGNTWEKPPAFKFNDNGDIQIPDPKHDNHIHGDLHSICFDPSDPSGRRVYIASDGGVCMTPDLGNTFFSHYNKQLRNIEFYLRSQSATPERGSFPGSLSLLIGGATQDHGNLYAVARPSIFSNLSGGSGPSPWKIQVGGDGGRFLLLRGRKLLYWYNSDDQLNLAIWNGTGFEAKGKIPLLVRSSFPPPPPEQPITRPVVERVNAPVMKNNKNETMCAVAAADGGRAIYGVFSHNNDSGMHYEKLTSIFNNPTPNPITALASHGGFTIIIGTEAGEIFQYDVEQKQLTKMNVKMPPATPGPSVRKIIISQPYSFAILNSNFTNHILRWNGLQWSSLNDISNLPDNQGVFEALEVDRGRTPDTIFVATRTNVYMSLNYGAKWFLISKGLPRYPNCTDLILMPNVDGVDYLYLSTLGWSMWRARLNL